MCALRDDSFTKRIVELSEDESAALLDLLFQHVAGNHDLQVRFRWERDSVAIWDNRATFHTATCVSALPFLRRDVSLIDWVRGMMQERLRCG